MKRIYILTSIFLFSFFVGIAQEKKSEVLIIATIHGAHQSNANFSYDSLFNFIEKLNPEIIGVEIRKEDVDSSAGYLKSFYPYEMYQPITKYPSKKVLGFDWLGNEIAGAAIPKDYWKEKSAIKKIQRKLAEDSLALKKLEVLNIIKNEKDHLALTATLRELNDGRYDLINRIYYAQLKMLLHNTEYKILPDFYAERDRKIAENIEKIIRDNRGKKMIFLMGADHRDYVLRKVSEEFGDSILLNEF